MLDLGVLILADRVLGLGRHTVCARRLVAADRDVLIAFLSDLENQSLLGLHGVTVVRRQPPAEGRVAELVLRGPLGLRRRARAHVRSSHDLVTLRVAVGRRTVAWVVWLVSARRGTTAVELSAQIESAGPLGHLALWLGGRRWLQRRFEDALDMLGAVALSAAEDVRPQATERAAADAPVA